jgi:hypothetical protein
MKKMLVSVVIALSLPMLLTAEIGAQGQVELEMPEFTAEEARQGNGRVFGARFSPDSSELWIARNQQLFVFDTENGQLIDRVATSPSRPKGSEFISNLWFVAKGKYLLLEVKGAGNLQSPHFGLLDLDHRSRHTRWFDPSGKELHGAFAGELVSGDLVFVSGKYKRESRLQHWTVIDPSAATLKTLPVDCEIAIELDEFTGRDNEIWHFLPQDICANDGVRLIAVQSDSRNPTIRSTSLKPIKLRRDGNTLVPVHGAPWSFANLPLAIHRHGDYVASQRLINSFNVLVHAHTRDGRMARVGELRIGSASRNNLGWHGDFLAVADFPDPPKRHRSVETSVRIATFSSDKPPRLLWTGKGVSASVATVSADGNRVLTQTVLREPPVQHSRWILWSQEAESEDQPDSRYD